MRRLKIAIVIFVIVGLMAAAGAALSVLPAIQNPAVENKKIKDITLDKIGGADDRLNRVIGRNESSINRAISSTVSATPRHERTGRPLVPDGTGTEFARQINNSVQEKMDQGRHIFRFDTFGDEDFWGGTLKLHQAIKGSSLGGVGAGVSPKTALDVGLKVDADALPAPLIRDLKAGKVDLDDPATTVALLKLNAVVGVKGFFNNSGDLESIGITCAFCHSTVDNSLASGIGHRLDGWANRDLNVGAIVNPQQVTDGVVTATNVPDGVYKTMNLGGIFVRENGLFMKPENKGRFYHDGRFATLIDVLDHYNTFFKLGLTEQEKKDVVEYLKSLTSP